MTQILSFTTSMNIMAKQPAASTFIKVRVTTGAKADSLMLQGETLRIAVKAAPKENKANVRVRELVAEHLGLPTSAVRITKGHHSSSKLLQVVKSH